MPGSQCRVDRSDVETVTDMSQSKVCQWINNLLNHKLDPLKRVARSSLLSFCKGNLENPLLKTYIIDQCYSQDLQTSRGYFIVLFELYKESDLDIPQHQLLNLFLFKTADRTIAIRRSAMDSLKLITCEASEAATLPNGSPVDIYDCIQAIESSIPETYLGAQLKLSHHLAALFPQYSFELLEELVTRLEAVEDSAKRQMLLTILPWIRRITLAQLPIEVKNKVGEHLLVITLRYGDMFPSQLQEIWQSLAVSEASGDEKDKDSNMHHISKLLMDTAVARQSIIVVTLCKRIVTYISRKFPQVMIDSIVSELSSPNAGKELTGAASSAQIDRYGSQKKDGVMDSNSFTSVLTSVYSTTARQPAWPLGRGHLALVLLAELSHDIGETFVPHLPIILHLAFLNLDNYLQPVYEHARILLLNLVHKLVVSTGNETDGFYEDALFLEEYLRSKEGKQVWQYEVTSLEKWNGITSKELANIIHITIRVLSVHHKTLDSLWSKHALLWAMNCPSHHLSCRSHQIFRQLSYSPSRSEVVDIMWTLGRTLNTPTQGNDVMGLTLEIIFTLQAIVDRTDRHNTLLLAQIFWIGAAMLYTNYYVLYSQSVELVCRVLSAIDMNDKLVNNIFRASIPRWQDTGVTSYMGLQPLAIRGLLHPSCEDYSIKLLTQILTLPDVCDDIAHPQSSRLITNVIALLPYLCLNVRPDAKHHRDAKLVASRLANAGAASHLPELEEVFRRYEEVGELETFLTELRYPLRNLIQMGQHYLVFSMLFQNLQYGISKNTIVDLQIIRHLFTVCLTEAITDERTRERLPFWLNTVTKYIHAPFGKEAVELIKTTLNLVPASTFMENHAAVALCRPYEFSNADNTVVSKAVGKVLESCKRDQEKSVTQDMPQSFWDSFFSHDHSPQETEQFSSSVYNASEMDEGTMRFATYVTRTIHKGYESLENLSAQEPNYPPPSIAKTEEREAAAAAQKRNNEVSEDARPSRREPTQFGKFPTFRGFDDILDFDDFEGESDDD